MNQKEFVKSRLFTYSKTIDLSVKTILDGLKSKSMLNVDESVKFPLTESGYIPYLINKLRSLGYNVNEDWIEVFFGPTVNHDKERFIMDPFIGSDRIDLRYPNYTVVADKDDMVDLLWFLKDGIVVRMHEKDEDHGFKFMIPYKTYLELK